MLTNPLGGYNLRHGEAVTALAKEAGVAVFEGRNPEEIAAALHTMAEAEPDVLVVNGGDGTVCAVVHAMRQERIFSKEPVLALLRGGSTNMIQNDVGLKGKPLRAIGRLMARIEDDLAGTHVVCRVPLCVRSESGDVKEHGFFWGAGALPRVVATAQAGYAEGGTRGPIGEACALLGVLKSLLLGGTSSDPRLAPEKIGWQVADAPVAEQVSAKLFAFVTTLDRLILGLDPGGSENSLRLVALKHPYSFGDLLSYLRARGRPAAIRSANFEFDSGKEITVRITGDWVLDGELFKGNPGSTLLRLKTKPPLRFLCFD